MKRRVLTREERKIVIDALARAAQATRTAKHASLVGAKRGGVMLSSVQAHVDELSRLAGTQDRLASEMGEHDVALEKLVS